MALAVTFLVVIVSLLKISVNAHENWDAVLAKRIVFAVDTSASMLLDVITHTFSIINFH